MTSRCGKKKKSGTRGVCSYHILTSSVIYYTESDGRFYIIRKRLFNFKIFQHNAKAGLLPRLCSTLVQSLNFPFFPPHIGAEPGRAKKESRITCISHAQNSVIFPPQIGGKTIFRSIFQIWLVARFSE